MADDALRRIAHTAARQHGAFTIAQAIALGMAPRTLQHRTASGLYESSHSGVLLVAGAPGSWCREVAAAVLSEGDLAAASHQTAAFLHGLVDRRGGDIHVVTRRWLRRKRPNVRVHESNDLVPADIVQVDGIATTSPTRTLVDLGATARWLVPGALGAAIRGDMTTLDEVERFIARVARKGRRGVGVIRPLIRERRRWEKVTQSDLEDVFIGIVQDFHLPEPVPQFVLFDESGAFVSRADFAYPDSFVLIELDGFRFHSDEQTFQRDRSKQNRAALLGWTVLRYTWKDAVERPGTVAAEIHSVLAS